MNKTRIIVAGLFAATALASTSAMADCKSLLIEINAAQNFVSAADKKGVTVYSALQASSNIAADVATGGYGLPMWVTVVDETGTTCAVTTAGATNGANGKAFSTSFSQKEGLAGTNASANGASNSQWLGSRVISAQKANTANAFSIDGYSISTANLYSAVQGDASKGSLYGLQHSNPVDAAKAYAGLGKQFGTSKDGMAGKRVGGVNVFGGGLALYRNGKKVGAIGVSGDTSCRDHAFAWEVRKALKLDGNTTGITTYNVDAAGAAAPTSGGVKGDEMVFATAGYWTAWAHPQCPNTVTGDWSIAP